MNLKKIGIIAINYNLQKSDMFRSIVRFSLTGILNTAVHAAIAISLIHFFTVAPPIANGSAFMGATMVSYIINTTWSFSKKLHKKSFFRFIVVSTFGFFLVMFVAWSAQLSGVNYFYGIFFVTLIITPTTFILHNLWTYK